MTSTLPASPFHTGSTGVIASREAVAGAIRALQIFCFLLFVFPSDSVIIAIGASGFPAGLVAIGIFLAWLMSILFGLHDPRGKRSPTRSMFTLWWFACIASYATRPWQQLSISQAASADRWLIQLAAMTGVALVVAECLDDADQIRTVLRALIEGAAVCAFVGLLQFAAHINLVPYLRNLLVGFQVNGLSVTGQARGALSRAAGTASNPLELATICGALIPAALYLAMVEKERSGARRYLPVFLLGAGVTVSVSRSGILALLIATVVWSVLLPPLQRIWVLALGPFAIAGVFLTTPGFLTILTSSATAGNSDPSIANRTNNYSYAARLISEHPWLGTGGGTYIADNARHIFDNEYMTVAVSMGLIGTTALIALLVVPPLSVLANRRRLLDPSLRSLGAALAGAGLAFAVCSATFDTFSFAMVSFAMAIVLGLMGSYVRASRNVWPQDPQMLRTIGSSAKGAEPR